jgi:hypothetical protein
LPRYAVTLLSLRKEKLPILRYDLALTVGVALTALVATQAGELVASAHRPALTLAVIIATVTTIWLAYAAILYYWRALKTTDAPQPVPEAA